MNDGKIIIGVVSDLHAEFWDAKHFDGVGRIVQERLSGADLILMAGDIDKGTESIRTARTLFPTTPVCLVAGNHEFYGGQHAMVVPLMRGVSEGTNVFFLHRESYVVNIRGRAVRVLGVTLWTDFNLHGMPALDMLAAKRGLNDFRLIRVDATGPFITPELTALWHQEDWAWLQQQLNTPFAGATIVLTHHSPVSFGIAPKFVGDALSPAFASNLQTNLIRDDVALVVWGHTHFSVHKTIDQTQFVSNQTGYVRGGKDTTRVETNDFGTLVLI